VNGLRLHKNNDGMTLIELIVSIAITAIVLSMIVLIINVAANSFRRTNENVNLQLEAQITINQLSALAMEASSIASSTKLSTPDIRYLLKGSSDSDSYAVTFIKAKNRLYLVQKDEAEQADDVTPEDDEYEYLLAEHVDQFDIAFEDTKTAYISITFKLGDEEYQISKKVKLRNAN
jgi:prepilin-type N-terminal cleavage/methylation domain-containing protein